MNEVRTATVMIDKETLFELLGLKKLLANITAITYNYGEEKIEILLLLGWTVFIKLYNLWRGI